MIFTEKYSPSRLNEVKGNSDSILKLRDFIANYKFKKKKAAILVGPTGVGKTSSVYAYANENNYEVLELNASDERNKGNIEEFMNKAVTQMSLFMKPKIILVDEIDGLSGTKDRGGAQALIKVLEKSMFPIIMVANDISLDKLSSLVKKTDVIEFNELESKDIYERLKEICSLEKLNIDDFVLRTISLRAGGDLRAAINDLQTLSVLDTKDTEIIGDRKKEEEINNILKLIFKSNDIKLINEYSEDINYDDLYSWVSENVVNEYNVNELEKSFDYLSKADIFRGRIRKWQYWRFLVYQRLFTIGVALAKEKKNSKVIMYKRPRRGLTIWQANMRNMKRKSISEKLANYYKVSNKKAYRDIYPDIVNLLHIPEVQNNLELDETEIEWVENKLHRIT